MISDIAPFVIAGVATGSVYAIAATGLVLTYKTSGVFNFAHGAQAALGAYVMWELWQGHGWPWPAAFAAALVIAGVLAGLILERMGEALSGRPAGARIVATVGLLVGLSGFLVVRYGQSALQMPYFLPTRLVKIGGTNVRVEQLILVIAALGTAVGLAWFFRHTRLGAALQAVVDDPMLLDLGGTNPVVVRRTAWVVGSCFAAASGALLAPTLGLDATLLTLLVVQAFGAAAIGRFSNLTMTYVGGLVIGVAQEVLKYVVTRPALADHLSPTLLQPLPSNIPFLVLFGILLVAPASQFVERGSRAARRERPVRRWPPMVAAPLAAVAVIGLLVLPHAVGARLPSSMAALGFVPIFASLSFLVRGSDQVSLCQLSFAAIGAAAYGHLHAWGVPFPLAILAAGLLAAPVGAVIAVPAIRLSGVYLAIATFGFGILVERMAFPAGILFGGGQRIAAPRPSLASGDVAYYHVLLAVAVAAVGVVVVVRRTRLGRLLRALADAPMGFAAQGLNATGVRTMAFCLSAFLAGVGGAVIGPVTGTASGGVFNFGASLTLVAVLYIAGSRPVVAPFAAAGLYLVLPSYLTSGRLADELPIAFGAAAVLAACGVLAAAVSAIDCSPRMTERSRRRTPARSRLRPTSASGVLR